jgi:hypothetical protein
MRSWLALASVLLLAPAAAAEVRSIEPLGIKADLPAGATIGKDPMESVRKRPGATIRGAGYMVSVFVSKHPSVDAAYEDGKSDLKSHNPTKVSVDEKKADGYLISFENKGSAGANYFVWSYKLLDGKGYQCQTTGSQPKAAETALAICRSLSK